MKNRFFAIVVTILRPIVYWLYGLQPEGLENVPEEAVVICPNHSSGWDPVLLCCVLGRNYRVRIMGKEQLFKIPVLGFLLKKVGAFPVDRGGADIAAVKTSIQSLKTGWSLLIFPEGTRVERPNIDEVKGGAAMIAIRSGVKMLPVFIGMNKRLFRKTRIVIGKPYEPVYTGRKGTAEEYQANAREVLRRAYELGDVECE